MCSVYRKTLKNTTYTIDVILVNFRGPLNCLACTIELEIW